MDKIKLDTAILAKEKGFGIDYKDDLSMYKLAHDQLAPTQTELQKWLREKHNIHIAIIYDWHLFNVNIMSIEYNILLESSLTNKIATYEDALEAGLIEALKLIK